MNKICRVNRRAEKACKESSFGELWKAITTTGESRKQSSCCIGVVQWKHCLKQSSDKFRTQTAHLLTAAKSLLWRRTKSLFFGSSLAEMLTDEHHLSHSDALRPALTRKTNKSFREQTTNGGVGGYLTLQNNFKQSVKNTEQFTLSKHK